MRLIERDDSVLMVIDAQRSFAERAADGGGDGAAVVDRIAWQAGSPGRTGCRWSSRRRTRRATGPRWPRSSAGCPPIRRRRSSSRSSGLADVPEILAALETTGRHTAVLTGFETDVCVAHSALGLLDRGFRVAVVADATGSPGAMHEHGIRRMADAGVTVVHAKGVYYEWVRTLAAANVIRGRTSRPGRAARLLPLGASLPDTEASAAGGHRGTGRTAGVGGERHRGRHHHRRRRARDEPRVPPRPARDVGDRRRAGVDRRRSDRAVERPRAHALRPARRDAAGLGVVPWFTEWAERVGGECGFTNTGFLWVERGGRRRARSRQHRIAPRARASTRRWSWPTTSRRLAPALALDGDEVAAYEPASGYADPTSTATGFMRVARERGARLVQGAEVTAISVSAGGTRRRRRDDQGCLHRADRRQRGGRLGGAGRRDGRPRHPAHRVAARHGLPRRPGDRRAPDPGRHRQRPRHVPAAGGQRARADRSRGRQHPRRLTGPRHRQRRAGLPRRGHRPRRPAAAGPRRRHVPRRPTAARTA